MNDTHKIREALESDAAATADLIYSTSQVCCFSVEQPCPDWHEATLKAEPLLTLLQQEDMICVLAEERGTAQGLRLGDPDAGALHDRALVTFVVPVYERLGFNATEQPQVFKGLHYQTMVEAIAEIQRALATS